jgi:hypothetical protein
MSKKRMRAAVALSLRLPQGLIERLKADAHDLGRPTSLLAREIIQDAYSVYGLPRPMTEALEADRQGLGLARREYVIELFSASYRHLVLQRTDGPHA